MVGNSNVTYGGARVLIVHISGSCTWKPRLSSAKNTFIFLFWRKISHIKKKQKQIKTTLC